jgi:maltose alpha-D-glucosyltransferase/alpha-amylase
MNDFEKLAEEASKRGIRIMMEQQAAAVATDMERIDSFWLTKGIAGFYPDSLNALTGGTQFDELIRLRHNLQADKIDAILLGKATVMPEENINYFGKNGNGLNMLFNVYVNQYLFYSLATGDVTPLTEALDETHAIPQQAQWAQFLRTGRELELSTLSIRQREKIYETFASDTAARLPAGALRRRLAPMLGGDRKKIELAYSLLFALPGTPIIRYGEEIGMGEDLSLKELDAINTPMQWSDSAQAGFSKTKKITRPVISNGAYSYRNVNVRKQLKDSTSLLRWTTSMTTLRRSLPAIARGAWKILPSGSARVLVIQYDWEGKTILTVHNLGNETEEVRIKLQKQARTLQNLLKQEDITVADNGRYEYTIEGYGYRWYKLK